MTDISITATAVLASANAKTNQGTAGASITAGQAVYKDTADGNKWKLADYDVAAGAAGGLSPVGNIGIALHAAASGQPLLVALWDDDFTIGATVAVGDVLTTSGTAGGIAPIADAAAGDYITFLGIAKSTTKIFLNPTPAGAVKV